VRDRRDVAFGLRVKNALHGHFLEIDLVVEVREGKSLSGRRRLAEHDRIFAEGAGKDVRRRRLGRRHVDAVGIVRRRLDAPVARTIDPAGDGA
jgi:hypothetical protein